MAQDRTPKPLVYVAISLPVVSCLGFGLFMLLGIGQPVSYSVEIENRTERNLTLKESRDGKWGVEDGLLPPRSVIPYGLFEKGNEGVPPYRLGIFIVPDRGPVAVLSLTRSMLHDLDERRAYLRVSGDRGGHRLEYVRR